MSLVPRQRQADWPVWRNDSTNTFSHEQIQEMLLMDIRDQLGSLLAIFQCYNAQAIPGILREIQANTKPRPRRRKTKAR